MADPFKKAGATGRPRQVWSDRFPSESVPGSGLYRHVGSAPEVCIPGQINIGPLPVTVPEPETFSSPQWEDEYKDASRQLAAIVKLSRELLGLRGQLNSLAQEVVGLKLSSQGNLVPVQCFAPEPYEVLKPFSVLVKQADDEYVACFPDANLTCYGDNEHEAVENLKGMILDTFDKFSSGRKLGPGPSKQLAVLRTFISKKG